MSILRQCLLYFIALGGPLAAYQFVPVLNITLPELASVLLVPLVILDQRGRNWPLPFELWWPALSITIACTCIGYWTAAWWPLAFAVTFVAIRSRGELRVALFLAVIGGGLGAIISLGAQFGWVYSTDATAIGKPFGALVGDGSAELVQMAFLAVVAAALLGKHGLPVRTRTAAGLAALALAAAALTLLARVLQAGLHSELRSLSGLSPMAVAAAALAAWIACRVLAKLALLHYRLRAPLAQPLFAALAIASLLAIVLLPAPQLVFAVLIAFAARATTPLEEDSHEGSAMLCTIPAVLLLLFNAGFISVANTRDPRNYDAVAEQLLEGAALDPLGRRLDALGSHFDEPRLNLWRARHALARGEITSAADAFVAAAAVPESAYRRLGRLPAPREAAFAAVLNQFRDVVSALPESVRGLSYERALVAAGASSSALASLRFRATGAAPAVDVETAAASIASRLGDPSLSAEIRKWPPAELAALCAHLGGCS